MAPSKSFVKLYGCFDEVNRRIHNLKVETVHKNMYLQNVIEHIGIGLLSFDKEGNIDIINSAARNILKIPSIRNLDRLKKIDNSLPARIKSVKPGQQELIDININNELFKIAVKASLFKIKNKVIRLISFQNIKNELEDNELDSYQKLIRILTHEIMNSTSPILSSIVTIKEFLIEKKTRKIKDLKNITQELLDDTVKGLDIIEERSIGLSHFVEKFRNLTLMPKPNFVQVNVNEFLSDIELLMKPISKQQKVDFYIEVLDNNLLLTIDKKLIEQVIINLITNSFQAFSNQVKRNVMLKARERNKDSIIIEIVDNGVGISDEEIKNIFIPFYSTKKDGSGIGLSLSRQIMRLHNGKISVKSNPGIETVFTLEF